MIFVFLLYHSFPSNFFIVKLFIPTFQTFTTIVHAMLIHYSVASGVFIFIKICSFPHFNRKNPKQKFHSYCLLIFFEIAFLCLLWVFVNSHLSPQGLELSLCIHAVSEWTLLLCWLFSCIGPRAPMFKSRCILGTHMCCVIKHIA